MSPFSLWPWRSNPNWYLDGEPGTRKQWRQRCWDMEDKLERLKREYWLIPNNVSEGDPTPRAEDDQP